MNFSKRTYALLAGGAIVLLVAIVAMIVSRSNADAAATASALETAPVRRGTLVATVSATGSISPLREAQWRSARRDR